MEIIVPNEGEDLISLATRCNALYICPKTADRRRKGPLVPYAGKDTGGANFVGDIYFNFRRIEPNPKVVMAFAETVRRQITEEELLYEFDTIVGIPNGGRTFGQALAYAANKRFVYPEKVPKETEFGKKQEYDWDFSQFDFEEGERVAIAEDVFNNFQNTDHTLNTIAMTGAIPVLLVGALNRSMIYRSSYTSKIEMFSGKDLRIVASINKSYPEYRQDDPDVAADVAAGNVEWQVKKNWARLRAAMDN